MPGPVDFAVNHRANGFASLLIFSSEEPEKAVVSESQKQDKTFLNPSEFKFSFAIAVWMARERVESSALPRNA